VADVTPDNDPAENAPVDQGSELSALGGATDEHLDEQEAESFPASDPHSDWAGPPN